MPQSKHVPNIHVVEDGQDAPEDIQPSDLIVATTREALDSLNDIKGSCRKIAEGKLTALKNTFQKAKAVLDAAIYDVQAYEDLKVEARRLQQAVQNESLCIDEIHRQQTRFASKATFTELFVHQADDKEFFQRIVDEAYEINAQIQYKRLPSSRANSIAQRTESDPDYDPRGSQSYATTTQTSFEEEQLLMPRLPQMHLPKFSGSVKEYNRFREIFAVIVENNRKLAPVAKLTYLMGALKDEAYRVASAYSLEGKNFEDVLAALDERYGRRTQMIFAELKRINKFPQIKENDPMGLRALYDVGLGVKTTLLKHDPNALDNPWCYIGIMLEKVPRTCLKEWTRTFIKKETELNRQLTAKEIQTEFFKFLNEWIASIEQADFMIESDRKTTYKLDKNGLFLSSPDEQTSTKENKPTNVANNHNRNKQDNRMVSRRVSFNIKAQTAQRCLFCGAPHGTSACKKEMPAALAYSIVKKKGACFNCLSINHSLQNCPSKSTCRKCGKKHHTKLHLTPRK